MDTKKRILDLLKKEEEISTSRISAELSLNYYYAEKYLNKLKDEGKIELIEKGNSKFWRLKKK